MPETTKRTSPRKGSSASSSNASSSNARSAGKGARRSRSSGSQNGPKPSGKKQAASSSQRKASRARAGSANAKQNVAEKVKDSGAGAVEAIRDAGRGALKTVAVPLATGAAGVIGGVLLDRVGFKRRHKILGIPLPGQRMGLNGVAKQIGEASKQFGKVASEIRATREKAAAIGKVLS